MLKLTLHICLTLILFAQIAMAQTKGGKTQKKTNFVGILKEKPWSKSMQSYCAQGSEYYVLEVKGKNELILQNDSKQDLAKFKNKTVKITGEIITKIIPNNPNPNVQQPVEPTLGNVKPQGVSCTVLATKSIQEIK